MNKEIRLPYISLFIKASYLFCFIFFVGLVYFPIPFYKNITHILTKTKLERQKKVNEGIVHIDDQLMILQKSIVTVADTIQTSKNDFDNLSKTLKKLANNELITAVGIVYSPQYKDRSLYLTKKGEGFETVDIAKFYDYTQKDWYKIGLKEKQWVGPFQEVSINERVMRYLVPIYAIEHTYHSPVGVLFVDIAQSRLGNLVDMLNLEKGYAFLIAADGSLITYPLQDYLKQYKTLTDLSQLEGKSGLKDVAHQIKINRQGTVSFFDTNMQEYFQVSFAPLSKEPWFFILITPKQMLLSYDIVQRELIYISLLFIFFVTFFFISIGNFFFYKYSELYQWFVSLFFSTFLFFLTGTLLYIAYVFPSASKEEKIIHNKVGLAQFIHFENRQNQQLKKPPPLYLPTGLQINTIEPKANNQVAVKGIVWQHYNNTFNNIKRSFDIIKAANLTAKELYRIKSDQKETVGWEFKTLLNLESDYKIYPFDTQKIIMAFFHPDFEKNIILTPDFDAYTIGEVGKTIGLGGDIKESSFVISQSYFYYEADNKLTNYGIQNATRQKEFPNLTYAIAGDRLLINPLITYLLPIIIIAFILFYILLEGSHSLSKKTKRTTTLGQMAILFLTAVVAHQTLRRGLDANVVGYLESYYFLIYILIIFIAYFVISFSYKKALMFHFFKFLYLPFIALSSCFMTIYFFYNF